MFFALLKKLWDSPLPCPHSVSQPRLTYRLHWHPSQRVRVCEACGYQWPAPAFEDVVT